MPGKAKETNDIKNLNKYLIEGQKLGEMIYLEEEETRKGTIIFNKINDKWCIDSNTDIVYLLFGSDL